LPVMVSLAFNLATCYAALNGRIWPKEDLRASHLHCSVYRKNMLSAVCCLLSAAKEAT